MEICKQRLGCAMSLRDVLRAFFGNAGKSVQLQAEIREGIANQAELFNQKLRELIEQQANQSARNEQLLRDVLDGVANQTNVLNQRLREVIEQQVNADARKELLLLELWSRRFEPVTGTQPSPIDISIAPLQPLPIPQISLRRPNPVADLMVTPEFKTYLDFFRTSPTVRRSHLTAENHAILYALIRKIRPAQALAFFRDGTAVSETIARGLCDTGAGQLRLFDDLDHRRTSAIFGLWPEALRKCCTLETGAPATTSKCSFALVGGDDAEATLAVLASSLDKLVEPGGLLVVTSVSRDGLRKLMSHRTEWRELGAQPEEENRTDFESRLVVYLRGLPKSAAH
jgi:hypothetical protein